MTDLAPTPVDIDTIGSSGVHTKCCREDAFICGTDFHPELVAQEDESPCANCEVTRFLSGCPIVTRPTHHHCPLTDNARRCPK